jgi:hypothetical protein
MHLRGLDPKDVASAACNPRKELGEIVRVQPIQSPPQTVIIEHLSRDSCSQQMLDRLVREELRHQIQLPVAEP